MVRVGSGGENETAAESREKGRRTLGVDTALSFGAWYFALFYEGASNLDARAWTVKMAAGAALVSPFAAAWSISFGSLLGFPRSMAARGGYFWPVLWGCLVAAQVIAAALVMKVYFRW